MMATCNACGMNYPDRAVHFCMGKDVSKPQFILGSVFEVMKEIARNPDIHRELIEEFKQEEGLEDGFIFTPELKAKMVDKLVRGIMSKARGRE